jgi:hypothetical protein
LRVVFFAFFFAAMTLLVRGCYVSVVGLMQGSIAREGRGVQHILTISGRGK